MTIKKAVSALRSDRSWLVRKVSGEIRLARQFGKKAITVRLRRTANGLFELLFPSYLFSSGVSHFTSVVDEIRFCRNKQVLRSLVRFLQRVEMWDQIENQNFIQINEHNKRAKRNLLIRELEELIGM